jgi:hypothetical protein
MQASEEIKRDQYRISAVLDLVTHRLDVQEEIQYYLPANYENPLMLVIEAASNPKAITLDEILVDGITETQANIENRILELNLLDSQIEKQEVNLKIRYTVNIPAKAARLGYTKNQINFGDWYPYIPPYDSSRGFLVYPPSPVGEHLNYGLADFDILITLENAPPSTQVAASALADQKENMYFYQLKNARSFAWSVGSNYQVESRQVGDTTIYSYYILADQAAGKAALDSATQAVTYYQDQIGQIALPSLSIVEGDFIDGMEYQGLFFLGQEYYREFTGSPQSYLVPLSAHETAHQWFYAAVANNQALEPWLDEALCTYMESLYMEKYYPDLLGWWWNYRVLRFAPQGWVNSSVYDYPSFRQYVDAVYLRGALWLDDFRSQIGDDAFMKGLQDYFSENMGKLASSENFFDAYREIGIDPLTNLYSVYFKASNQ